MNKYFNVSLTGSYKSNMNNYNYNFDVDKISVPPVGTSTYFPLTNTTTNPVYQNTGNDDQTYRGQSYTFVPNDGLYFDEPPTDFTRLLQGSSVNDPDVGLWDVSNITSMWGMFQQTPFNQDIGDWDTSNVNTMQGMFINTPFNQDIGRWNTSNVTLMGSMFQGSNFNHYIGDWDTSNVTEMSQMFAFAHDFNQDIGGWNTSKVTAMFGMFNGTSQFQQSKFNQDIGGWDVSNVTNMVQMFSLALSFNQDLSGWCVTKIPSEPLNFIYPGQLAPANMPVWGTCP